MAQQRGNITVDYVRHLLKRNGCRAHVSIVDIKEIENEIGVQNQDVQDEERPLRMAAAVDIQAQLADLGVRVIGGHEP